MENVDRLDGPFIAPCYRKSVSVNSALIRLSYWFENSLCRCDKSPDYALFRKVVLVVYDVLRGDIYGALISLKCKCP